MCVLVNKGCALCGHSSDEYGDLLEHTVGDELNIFEFKELLDDAEEHIMCLEQDVEALVFVCGTDKCAPWLRANGYDYLLPGGGVLPGAVPDGLHVKTPDNAMIDICHPSRNELCKAKDVHYCNSLCL